jgi:hypothetical protein
VFLGSASEAFYPILMVAVEHTGVLASEFLEEQRALLRLESGWSSTTVRHESLRVGSNSVTCRLIRNPTVTRLNMLPCNRFGSPHNFSHLDSSRHSAFPRRSCATARSHTNAHKLTHQLAEAKNQTSLTGPISPGEFNLTRDTQTAARWLRM